MFLGLSKYPVSAPSHESDHSPHPDSGEAENTDLDIDMDSSSASEESSEEFELPHQEGIDLGSGVVQRVIRYLVAQTEEKQTKAYNQGTTAIFTHLCELLDIDHSVFQTMKKRRTFDAIRDLVCLAIPYMISMVIRICSDCLGCRET